MPDRTQMVRFPGCRGGLLAARLELPPGSVHAYALFAQCFMCSKETLAAVRVSGALRRSGIAVLRFDFTGPRGSDGEFANTNFSSNGDDLIAAANGLRETHLVAALGACTSMTLRLHAAAKKLPLKHVSMQLKHEKIHARDCMECDTSEEKIDRIEREIQLEGALSAAERTRLLEIADRCPVHRTLTSPASVRTRLKPLD
jgi:uncharacterized OsmC-like protein